MAFLFLLAAISWGFLGSLHTQSHRDKWIEWLDYDQFSQNYRAALDWALNHIDRGFSPEWNLEETDRISNPKTEPGRAWTHHLLGLNLLLAVAYPIFGLLFYWGLTGNPGRIGSLEVIPAQPDGWSRAVPFALLSMSGIAAIMARRAKSNLRRRTLTFVAAGLVVAVAVAVTVAGAVAVAGAVTVAGAFAFAVAGAVAGAFFQEWLGAKFDRQRLALLLFSLFTGTALAVVVYTYAPDDLNADNRSVVFFIGLLPLLNAWADFLSFGLTRWMLRRGVLHNSIAWNSLKDAVYALLIFLALTFSIILAVHFIRPGGGPPLIDITELLTDLHDPVARHDYWWLAFMLFSTLLPTFLHLCIGCFAFLPQVSRPCARWIAAGLSHGNNPGGKAASAGLSVLAALAIWLPLLLIWLILTWIGPLLLDVTLFLCDAFNTWLNARWPLPTP